MITAAAAPGSSTPSAESLRDLYRRPAEIPFPADNPYTPEKAELGKILYFDPRLSRVGALSCASCHNPSFGWEDGRPRAVGDGMAILERHSQTILNGAWGGPFFWDGRAKTLEDQATKPIVAAAEMNMPLARLVPELAAIEGYQRRFAAAFPGRGINPDTIAQAISTFERIIVSSRAPFDSWVEGKDDAISASAKRGFVLFNSRTRCAVCHSGWRFTNDSFHDIGLASEGDEGRAKLVPGELHMRYAFKTPSLRNIDQRAPYMHDGSVPTLDAVMRHYREGIVQRPSLSPDLPRIDLSEAEMADLVAFMQSLTSDDRPIPVPVLP